MSKFKIGDKVRVREDLEARNFYGFYLNEEMAKLKGKVVEIKDVYSDSYSIKEDTYHWAEKMFSGLAEEPRNLIPLIAKELGVEMDEEFNIVEGFYNPYRFSETDLLDRDGSIALNSLRRLLNGEFNIEKLPPKPRLNEKEYIILSSLEMHYEWLVKHPKTGIVWVCEREEAFELNGFPLNMFTPLFWDIRFDKNSKCLYVKELLDEYENHNK